MHLLLALFIVSIAYARSIESAFYDYGTVNKTVPCEDLQKLCEEPSVWEQDAVKESHCVITFSGSEARTAHRLVALNSTFSVRKDILSDFLIRLEALRFSAGNPSAVRSSRFSTSVSGGIFNLDDFFGPLEQKGLRYTGSLCFPRLSLLWQWLSGNHVSPINQPCCSQDCWWAALLRKYQSRMLTLQDLLLEASTTSNQMTTGKSPCGSTPPYMNTEPQHVAARRQHRLRYENSSDYHLLSPIVDDSSDSNMLYMANLILGAAQSIDFAFESIEGSDVLFWTMWLFAPGFMVAHEALEFVEQQPLMSLYVSFMAATITFAEYLGLILILSHPLMGAMDKVLNLLFGYVVTTGFSAMAAVLLSMFLPLLNTPAASNAQWAIFILWTMLLVLPVLTTMALPTVLYFASYRSVQPAAGRRTPAAGGRSTRAGSSGSRRSLTVEAAHTNRSPLRPVATGAPAAGRGITITRMISSSGTTASAAANAIHWPPPLEITSWLEEECEIPYAFRCPITLTIMREPTSASSGITYERHAIFQWLARHRVDPVTHVPLKRHRLTPNLNLRCMIENWHLRVKLTRSCGKHVDQIQVYVDLPEIQSLSPTNFRL
eukprot:gene30247-35231_t